ncbi:MAG: rRNA maturation RNase YbeY [Bacteroidota bacterium]
MAQSQSLSKIEIYGNKSLLKGKLKQIKFVLNQIAKDHFKQIGILEITLVTDEELLQINIDQLNHNYYTDIITFDYCYGSIIEGDIYISLDRTKDNAKTFATSSLLELSRVIFHGVLHLAGYKDKTKTDKQKMTEMENKYLVIFKNLFHGEHKL